MKGCPAYDLVKQPSMNDFNLEKYQGKWYEHKFHDWTQFKEVYDTTLDIKVSQQTEILSIIYSSPFVSKYTTFKNTFDVNV